MQNYSSMGNHTTSKGGGGGAGGNEKRSANTFQGRARASTQEDGTTEGVTRHPAILVYY